MDIIQIIYLIAIAFAFASVLVIHLRIKTEQKLLLGYLSGYLLILGISNLMLLFVMTGWMIHFPYLYKVFMPLSLLSPVIAYWYVKGSLGQAYVPKKWELLHLAPFLIVTIHYLPFFAKPIGDKIEIVRAVIENNEVIVDYSYGWIFNESQIFILRTLQAVIYLVMSWRTIKSFQKANEIANKRSVIVLRWLTFFVRAMSTYLVAIILCYILFGLRYNGIELEEIIEQIVFIFTASLVFILSAFLLLNPKAALAIDRPVEVLTKKEDLSFDVIVQKINEHEWHRDIDLTITALTDQLGLSKSEFSTVIKLEGYANFSGFINSIRLQCFIENASLIELEKNSIEGIAHSCGFKSSSTFYRVFKEKYQMSPKKFLENNTNKLVD